jgi:iron-sulfur cluster assembly protein
MMMMTSQSATSNRIVEVTPAALLKMGEIVVQNPNHAIRLGVLGGGCAGLQYDMQPTQTKTEGDFVQDLGEGLVLYIHPVAAAYLKGTTVDFVDAMMDGGFKFINPNATNTCGCGTSFGI